MILYLFSNAADRDPGEPGDVRADVHEHISHEHELRWPVCPKSAVDGLAIFYDLENRVTGSGGDLYWYAPDNKRVWKKKPDESEEVYYYGLTGQRLGTYALAVNGSTLSFTLSSTNVYFGGKLTRSGAAALLVDRLGSVVYDSGPRSYYPYGEERVVTTNDRDKFGEYYRDATTGLDYADQRYYASQYARFLTADPFRGSGRVVNPLSWNRYPYIYGDPINSSDPTGLESVTECLK